MYISFHGGSSDSRSHKKHLGVLYFLDRLFVNVNIVEEEYNQLRSITT